MVSGAALRRTPARLSVLVVDDEPDIREFFEDFFHIEGCRVTTLADPTAVVQRIRDELFHLVMLDLMMPKIDGLDLIPQIRAVDRDIAVIVMTSYPSLGTLSQSIQLGAAAYIGHPLSPTELRDIIARVTQRKDFVLRREDDLHVVIGRRIRTFRKTRGLTLKQIARRTKLSISVLSQIERASSSASVSSLFKIATALDVRLAHLFSGY